MYRCRSMAGGLGNASAVVTALTLGAVAAFAAMSRAAPPEKPTGRTPTCVTEACHADLVEHRVMHGPTAQRKCGACHVEDEPREHRFRLAGEPETLCTTCHVISRRTYVHEPVRQGRCIGCHDPHGSEQPMMLRDDPTRGLCRRCHRETDQASKPFVHAPVAAGACILCHEAHTSWEPALLTEEPRALCLGCHTELEPDPVADRYRHAPVEESCLACHDAHASAVRYQLRANAPELCYTCHEPVHESIESFPVVHGAVTEPGGCLACHAAHFSALPALQRRPEIDLCLGCHDRVLETPEGRTLTNMAALLRDNPDHHGPIRDGTCTVCHLPHAAERSRLLRKAYPPEFYAPFEIDLYALCFTCHIEELVKTEHGTGLTRFRDGDRNLHWLHVNRKKGRTCRACHEVHASKNPFHIRDSVPFGTKGWALEIGFRRTPTGGTCAPGCHKPQSYDHGPAADAPAVGAPAVAPQRGTP